MIRCAECGVRLRFEEIADHMDEKHPPHDHELAEGKCIFPGCSYRNEEETRRDRARLDSTTRIGQAMVTATRQEEDR